MRALFARPQLGDHAGPDGLLGLQETVEDKGEGHGGSLVMGLLMKSSAVLGQARGSRHI
ncbi:hypothetical protein D3C72_2437720 [compost metagenome]